MKLKFESYDDLTLGKILCIPGIIIVAGYVLQEDFKCVWRECVYESLGES